MAIERIKSVTLVDPPRWDCPKCGDLEGFVGVAPVYRPPSLPDTGSEDERLEWTCVRCGYTIHGPTGDTP
jgi:ribosomal protein S27AE